MATKKGTKKTEKIEPVKDTITHRGNTGHYTKIV